MDPKKEVNESEMGSGESDDEFYNVKLPYTPESSSEKTSKKVEVQKVYSPPRTKVQYDYKFDTSSDEESETKKSKKDTQTSDSDSENSDREKKKNEEPAKERKNSHKSSKGAEKTNEELEKSKNSESQSQSENTENSTGQSQITTSASGALNVPRPPLGVVSPVMVVPPPMVVPQASVMGPMLVPSALGMGGPVAMMPSQNLMGNMIRGPGALGLASNAIPNSMIGMNAVPGMMAMQGNLMGIPGGMIDSTAAMGGMNMGLTGNLLRMQSPANGMFRVQGPNGNLLGFQGTMGISRPNTNLVGIPRPVNIPPPPSNLMVNNPVLANPTGRLMVMGGMMGNRAGAVPSATPGSLVGNNKVRMLNTPQGNLPVRVPPPPPFMNLMPRAPALGENIRWPSNPKTQLDFQSTSSSSGVTSNSSSPSSSPRDKSRDYDGDEYSKDDQSKSASEDSDESQSPPREIPNTFKNDGSFMEMFKKMTEESESNQDGSSSNDKSETTDSTGTVKKPSVMISGIVGKRRGGRVLKTGLVKKVKKDGEAEEEKHPKDAWSMYMAEVKKYREASCEEEGKTRPLVK